MNLNLDLSSVNLGMLREVFIDILANALIGPLIAPGTTSRMPADLRALAIRTHPAAMQAPLSAKSGRVGAHAAGPAALAGEAALLAIRTALILGSPWPE